MSERFGTLRSILQKTPSDRVWREIVAELGLWGEEERDAVALPYVADHLHRWPPTIKRGAMLSRSTVWGPRLSNELFTNDVGLMRALLEDAAWVAGCRHLRVERPKEYEALAGHLERFDQLISLSIPAYMMDEEAMVSLVGGAWPPSLRELSVEGLSHQRKDARRLIVEALAGNASLVGLETLRLRFGGLSSPHVEALMDSTNLPNLRALDLSGCALDAACMRALSARPHMRLLRALDLSSNRLGAENARVLARGAALEGLTTLDVSRNPLGEGLAALLGSPHARGLTRLKMEGARLDPAGARALCAVAWPPGLERFELDEVHCDRRTFDALAGAPILRLVERFSWRGRPADQPTGLMASPHLTGLRELELVNADAAVMAAAANPALSGLGSLKLRTQQLSAACVAALASSALSHSLRSLELNAWHPGIGALFEAGSWGALRRLTLNGLTRADGFTGCRTRPTITDEDVERLARSEVLGRLEALELNANLLSDMAAMALAASGALANLRELGLMENKIRRAGALALLRSLPPDALEGGLNLHDNPLTHEDIIALAAEPALANLRGALRVSATDAREETWRALIDSPHTSAPTREQARFQLERLRSARGNT